eukprot:3532797-Pleurochrysis_carterae.AAC.1
MTYFRIHKHVQTQGKYERADTARMREQRARARVCGAHAAAARMLETVQCGRHQYGAPLRPWRYE